GRGPFRRAQTRPVVSRDIVHGASHDTGIDPTRRRTAAAPSAEFLLPNGEQLLARLFAATARLGADPAVLVMRAVPGAFVAARPAGRSAGLEHRAGDRVVVARTAAQDAGGRRTQIGTVEVGADTRDELGHGVLTEAGVGARGTCLRAVAARLDTRG